MTQEEVQAIIQKYVDSWNAERQQAPLWVTLAAPGDHLSIPGVNFGSPDQLHAGMELPVHAHLIVLNKNMKPESLLSTFLHEFGHARYRISHSEDFDHVESEVAAIAQSLESLADEGLDALACQEVHAVIQMGSSEPYRSAVEQLSSHPLWRRFS